MTELLTCFIVCMMLLLSVSTDTMFDVMIALSDDVKGN